jgi:hypothetical protein
MKDRIKKLLREFSIDELDRKTYKDGQLSLEYVDAYDYPKYVIYYDTEEPVGGYGDETNIIVAELDSRFFDERMARIILQYLITR